MRAIVSWSGGKDSSLALNKVLAESQDIQVLGLLTTVTRDYDRISMHGVRRSLLKRQATSTTLPLFEVFIPKSSTNKTYEYEMISALTKLKNDLSVSAIIFGDLFLRDVREYREKLMSKIDLTCVFPLWGVDTKDLANRFLDLGFRAILCTVNPKMLDPSFCGREFDKRLLSDLPDGVDPCGENGEFHTFVYDGPIFKSSISVTRGEVVERDGFVFADLLEDS
jgi:uncharacterized protein (TIGR00290 family)